MTSRYSRNWCWLKGYGPCWGRITDQHLINRAKYPKGGRVDKYIQEHEDIFIVPVCLGHNSINKLADAGWARKVLLQRLLRYHDEDYVRDVIDNIPWKVPQHNLTFDGIMSVEISTFT